MKKTVCAVLAIALAVSGCASMSAYEFHQRRYSLTNAQVCGVLKDAIQQPGYQFAADVREEMARRGIDDSTCQQINAERTRAIALGVGALAVAAALVAGSKKGGGSVPAQSYAPTPVDYSWQWDQFYNAYRQLVWACRGEQTGQFAELSKCAGKAQLDWKWPSKEAPR